MATTYAHSSVTTVKNDGATLVAPGDVNVSDGVVTKTLQLNDLADDFGKSFGSKVVANDGTGAATTDRVGVAKVKNAVALPYNAPSTAWLIRGVATTIGGLANNSLLSGSDYDGSVKDNIHEINHTHLYGSGNGTFDFYARSSTDITPNYTKGAGAGDESNFVRPSGAGNEAATDEAATPTRSVPGELTYRFGAPLPFNDNYKAKDVFES